MKDKLFDKIYKALKTIPRLSALGVAIFVAVGLVTNMNKGMVLLTAWGILVITLATVWLASRICMELDTGEDYTEEED